MKMNLKVKVGVEMLIFIRIRKIFPIFTFSEVAVEENAGHCHIIFL